MTERFTFSKEEHLKSRKAIDGLFKSGKSFFCHPYKVFFRLIAGSGSSDDTVSADKPGQVKLDPAAIVVALPPIKAGFAVSSRNFKRAVDRNRVKRLGREAYRLNKQAMCSAAGEKGTAVEVFFVFTGKTLPNFTQVQAGMQGCLERLMAKLKSGK